MIRSLIVAMVLIGVAFAAGCKHKCGHHYLHHDSKPCCPPGSAPGAGSPYLLPPAGLPTTPGPATVPPVGPSDLRNYPPARPAPEVLLPDPYPGTGSSRSTSPGFLGGPVNPTQPQVAPRGSNGPVGLSGYVRVAEGLASGRKPSLDGFDALKQNGFRTILYLHASGADWSQIKDIASKRGLAFVAIETTPEKLAGAIEQFNATVGDAARHPIYVCDDDGIRAGVVWYMHFRTADSLNDDSARVRARPLGLTEDGDEARAFSLAAQRYLESR